MTLNFSSISLPLTALIIDSLDCDVLASVPFCKENDIQVHLKDEKISIGNSKVPYVGVNQNQSVMTSLGQNH